MRLSTILTVVLAIGLLASLVVNVALFSAFQLSQTQLSLKDLEIERVRADADLQRQRADRESAAAAIPAATRAAAVPTVPPEYPATMSTRGQDAIQVVSPASEATA